MPNYIFTKNALKALLSNTSSDPNYILANVALASDGSAAIASDGHALVMRLTDPDDNPKRSREWFTAPNETIKMALKVTPAKGTVVARMGEGTVTVEAHSPHPYLSTEDPDPNLAITTFEADLLPVKIDFEITIPNLDRPSADNWYVSAPLLSRVLSSLVPAKPKGNNAGRIQLSTGGQTEPFRLDVSPNTTGAVDDCAWIAVIMPLMPG